MADGYLLAECPMLTGLNLIKSGPWEAGSMVKNTVKVLKHIKDIPIFHRVTKISKVPIPNQNG